jgi:hypothetical protein
MILLRLLFLIIFFINYSFSVSFNKDSTEEQLEVLYRIQSKLQKPLLERVAINKEEKRTLKSVIRNYLAWLDKQPSVSSSKVSTNSFSPFFQELEKKQSQQKDPLTPTKIEKTFYQTVPLSDVFTSPVKVGKKTFWYLKSTYPSPKCTPTRKLNYLKRFEGKASWISKERNDLHHLKQEDEHHAEDIIEIPVSLHKRYHKILHPIKVSRVKRWLFKKQKERAGKKRVVRDMIKWLESRPITPRKLVF